MFWILRALLGRWACPWCLPAKDTWWDRNVIDRLPDRLIIAMSPYDRWVGQTGIPIHQRHAPWDREDAQEAS